MSCLKRKQHFASLVAALAAVAVVPARAETEPTGKNGAKVEKWAEKLEAPQGLARDHKGNVFVVESGAGRVLRFERSGKKFDVYVEGLKAPAFALYARDDVLYVGQRNANLVATVRGKDGALGTSVEVADPLGLAPDPQNPQAILVVSHRTSEIKRFFVKDVEFSGKKVRYLFPSEEPQAQVFAAAKAGGKYGWRDLVLARGGTLYVTDEVAGAVLRRVPGGSLEEWAKGLSSPSGLALSPSGELFVTEEGTGRLSRVAPDGRAVVVAEGLGQARDALFLDRRRVLVTDRAGGNVWLVTLPPGR